MRGLSLREVAEAVGVSQSFLSMVERGATDLSLTRFSRLTEFYNVAPSELMLEMGTEIEGPTISDVSDTRSPERGEGVTYNIVLNQNPQMIYMRLEPGAATDLRAHRGEDFWLVLDGTPQLHYGGKLLDLVPEQTARFSGTVPHGLSNPSDEPARLVAVCSIPYW